MSLASLIGLQRTYLNSLPQDTTGDTARNALASDLDGINTALSGYSTSIDDTLSKQADMKTILDNETARLTTKKASIDTALEGQKRIIELNDSYRQRTAQYINIIVVIIITLVLILGLMFLSKTITFIPGYIYDISIGIVFVFGLYFCYLFYLTIYKRTTIDFNKLRLPPPAIKSPDSDEVYRAQMNAAAAGQLLGTVNAICTGSACCTDNTTHWDNATGKCAPGAAPSTGPSTFTTLSLAYKHGEVQKQVSPNSPNEFSNYGVI